MLDKEDFKQIADLMNVIVENVVAPRFDLLAEGQTAIVERLDRLEVRMDHLEERMDRLEVRMDRLEERMDHLEVQVHSCLEDITLLQEAQ